MAWRFGGLAQLGERLPCKQEVSGSIPLISTKKEQSKTDSKPSEADLNRRGTTNGTDELSAESKAKEVKFVETRARSSAG